MKQKTLFSRVAKALCLAFMFTVVGISTLTGAFGTAFASNAPLVDKSQVEVPSEDEYAYSIMVMGDPQYMTICDYQNGTNYTDRYYSWIAENASKLKTKFLVGVGDIVHNDTEREFRDVVKPALAKFDTVGLPYALVRGNHDNRAYWYDKYIGGESQYMKQDTIVSYYANPDDDERLYSTKARNTAHEYIVGETKYLVICLDFGAQDPVLEWANSVVGDSKYANHNVFVTTHGYMSGSAEYLDGIAGDSPSRYNESYDDTAKTVPNPFIDKSLGERVTYKYNAKVNPDESFNDGDDIWDKFVRKHANIKAVFCGHVYAEEIVYANHVGDHGNIVQEIVINPQVWDDDGKDDGAAGYADSLTGTIAILYCSEDGQAITVRNYSVLKDKYLGEESQFEVRLNSREWTEGEGKTFVRDKLYSLENPLTSFPKTVEVNMKYSAPTSNKMVVSSFSGGGVNFAVRVMKANASKGIDAGDLGIFYSGEGASLTFKSVNYADDDKYHHYAFTFDDSNAYCYVDGILKETVAHSWGKIDEIDMSSKLPFAIGGDFRVNNAGMNGEYFPGSLKSVAVFNDIRTAEEIVADTKYSIGGDANAVVSVDLTNIGEKSEIANFADKDNPVVLKKVKFANTEGMTFDASKLYSFKKALTAFPKTIEVYMKSAIPSANKVILGNYSGTGTNGTEMTLRVKNGGQLSIFYNGEQYSVTFDTKVDNAYHLYSFVMDGENALLYVDGALKETKTIPLKGTDTSANDPNDWNYDTFNGLPWCIGGDNRSGNGGYFTGAIKYVTAYSDVRTASEISAMATGNTARIFEHDENALFAVDMASAVSGGHIANYADENNTLYAPGKTFTKTVVNSVASVFASAPYSTEAVIRGTGANQWIVGNYIDWGNKNTWYGIKYLTGNKISVSICGSGWSSSGATFDTVIPTNRYVHIAVVLDGTKAYLYVDGKLSDTKDFVLNAVWATKWRSSMPMVIGGDNRSGNAQALTSATIQSVAIYSTIRTAEDIEKSYVYGIDPNASGLMAGYEFGGFNDKTVYQNLNKNGAVLVASNHNFKANETYLDIADYGVNTDGYIWGQEQTSSQSYRGATYKLWDYSVKGDTNPNIGLEFRYKSVDTKAQIAATMSAQNYTSALYMFTNVRLGHSFFDISLPNDLSYLSIRSGHFRNTETSSTAKTMMFYEDPSPVNLIAFEDNAEYIFRFTRTAIDASVDNGYGALLCVYVGKINPTTNMPEEGWDTTPKYTHLALYERNSTQTNECGISVEPGWINNNNTMPHTLIISSNKYCGVKVDGVMSKHERGTEFAFADDSDKTDNIFLIGYSAGATTYSADDFVSAGGKKVINKSTEFKSLSVTLNADAFASARFRNRVASGKVQPLELALNWGANATFTNDLDTYFSVKFGYNLTASNGATSGDIEVSKVIDNAFSVTQSNIGENFYDLKFSFRAYIEINGTKYYTAEIDANDGDSVSAIASELVSELSSESTANKTNAIKDSEGNVIGYHYLTQSQYDLAKQIAQA